jgi:hypothetical protein
MWITQTQAQFLWFVIREMSKPLAIVMWNNPSIYAMHRHFFLVHNKKNWLWYVQTFFSLNANTNNMKTHKGSFGTHVFRGLGCISHVFLVKTLSSLGDWSCFDKSGCVLVRLDPCREQPSPLAHASYATSQMVRRRELVDRCQVKSLWSATASSRERNARGA